MGKNDDQMTLTVVVDTAFAAKVDALASAQGATRAGYVRWLLQREVNAKYPLGQAKEEAGK